MRFSYAIIGAICACALSGASAVAQEVSTNRVAAITDWSVFVAEDPKQCWSVTEPSETVNTRDGRVVAVNRGTIHLMVFFQPQTSQEAMVYFTGGYPFREDSQVTVSISGTEFKLFTDDDGAWTSSSAEDARLIDAMKRGAEAVVTGISSRGTTTKDTFSLLGFTAAMEEAEKRCGS